MTNKPEAKSFDDFGGDIFDDLSGDGLQTLGQAAGMDHAMALTTPDLFPAGTYILAQEPGEWAVAYHKDPAANSEWLEVRVMKWREALWADEFAKIKASNELVEGEDKCYLAMPPWVVARCSIECEAQFGSPAFLKHAWDNYRSFWLDESRAPKY